MQRTLLEFPRRKKRAKKRKCSDPMQQTDFLLSFFLRGKTKKISEKKGRGGLAQGIILTPKSFPPKQKKKIENKKKRKNPTREERGGQTSFEVPFGPKKRKGKAPKGELTKERNWFPPLF